MQNLSCLSIVDETTSKWTIKGPVNIGTLSWKANIIKDEPGNFISWASVPGSVLETSGKVRFLSNGRNGTILHVNISYRPNVGILGAVAAKTLSPALRNMMRHDLRGLKGVSVE